MFLLDQINESEAESESESIYLIYKTTQTSKHVSDENQPLDKMSVKVIV